MVYALPLAAIAAVVSFLALHHGTYPLADRQMAALVLWLVLGAGFVVGWLPRAAAPPSLWTAAAGLAALAAWTAIALAWTESSELTFAEVARVVGYLGVVVAAAVGIGRHNWRLVAAGALFAAVLVCALAVASRLWPAGFPDEDVASNLKVWRLSYPFGYWNALGCWSAITVTLCIAWASHARSAIVRALALAAVPVCCTAMYLTFSRAALGGMILGIAVVIALSRYRWLTALQCAVALVAGTAVILVVRGHPGLVHGTDTVGAWQVTVDLVVAAAVCGALAFAGERFGLGERLIMRPRAARVALAAGTAVGLIALIALAFAAGDKAVDEFNTTDFANSSTADARLVKLNGNRVNLWRSAERAFESEPLSGIGPGTYGFWWNRDGVNDETVRDAHNIYLEALAESGVPGLLLLLLILGSLAFGAVRARGALRGASDLGAHAGLTGVFVVFLFQAGLDWIWESTAVTVLVLLCVATAASVGSPLRRHRPAASARIVPVLAAAGAIVLMLPGLRMTHSLEQSRAAFRAGEYSAAVGRANDAIDAESWAASAYGQRALAYEAAGDLDAASRDLAAAVRREPTNWVWPLLDVRVETKRGNAAKAAERLETARKLRPYAELFGDR